MLLIHLHGNTEMVMTTRYHEEHLTSSTQRCEGNIRRRDDRCGGTIWFSNYFLVFQITYFPQKTLNRIT